LEVSGAALLGGALFALEGCGGPHTALLRLPPTARREQAEILNHVLDLEHSVIAAYTAGIPLLSASARDAARRFLDQDLTHAGELAGLVKQVGSKPHEPKASYELGQPRRAADVLRLLHAREQQVIAAYLAALPRLTPGPVRAAVASVMANDAQHVSLLRAALDRRPVPAAFVTASE
jgi:hypothetical protein